MLPVGIDELDARLVFGHTHVPVQPSADPPGLGLVHPGGVGVPLDSDPRASVAVFVEDSARRARRVRDDPAATGRRYRPMPCC